MNRLVFGVCVAAAFALGSSASHAAAPTPSSPDSKQEASAEKPEGRRFEPFKPEATTSNGSVSIDGRTISYQAVAGSLVVHPKEWDDVPRDPNMEKSNPGASEDGGDAKNPTAVASMFYVAYFKEPGRKGSEAKGARPVTFIFNGGPGSASFWLHMGAFGPRRIVTSTDAHTPAAPYSLVNNASSLLDASDQFYESGHMVYAKDTSLKMLHDNVAGFIRRTSNVKE